MSKLGRLAAILCAIALLRSASATPAAAQSALDVVAALSEAQNAAIEAALDAYRGQGDQALGSLDQARLTLGNIGHSRSARTLAKTLAGKIRTAAAKTAKARRSVAGRQRITVQLKKLRVAAQAVLRAALAVGHPVVGEIDAASAGFHHPGDEIHLQIYAADGSICTEPAVVDVVNDSFGTAVDLNSVVVDQATGVVSITLGPDQGLARVTVTACGQTTTVLLYNYGPEPPEGLPKGFPINLPLADYSMTCSGEIAGASLPPTNLGTFTFVDLATFADEIGSAFRQAASVASGIPGCGMGVHYSGYDGSGFSIAASVHCSLGGYGISGNLTCRVDQV